MSARAPARQRADRAATHSRPLVELAAIYTNPSLRSGARAVAGDARGA